MPKDPACLMEGDEQSATGQIVCKCTTYCFAR